MSSSENKTAKRATWINWNKIEECGWIHINNAPYVVDTQKYTPLCMSTLFRQTTSHLHDPEKTSGLKRWYEIKSQTKVSSDYPTDGCLERCSMYWMSSTTGDRASCTSCSSPGVFEVVCSCLCMWAINKMCRRRRDPPSSSPGLDVYEIKSGSTSPFVFSVTSD